jgi:hypothetical protein
MTPAVLAYFDRLSEVEYDLLEHLNQHGLLTISLDDLLARLVQNRLQLAEEVLTFARSLDDTQETHCKQIIGRCYYVMHHAARAVLLYEQHYETPDHTEVIARINRVVGSRPSNTLRTWKGWRTRADYNPVWPVSWRGVALQSQAVATQFLQDMRAHLRMRGATYV